MNLSFFIPALIIFEGNTAPFMEINSTHIFSLPAHNNGVKLAADLKPESRLYAENADALRAHEYAFDSLLKTGRIE